MHNIYNDQMQDISFTAEIAPKIHSISRDEKYLFIARQTKTFERPLRSLFRNFAASGILKQTLMIYCEATVPTQSMDFSDN